MSFQHIFDVRAVRVIVPNIAQCYAVLGVVHGKWTYIPGEFDDYIATPKGNNYQSLHTAVIGPERSTLEIQIRTPEMDSHAELGVAAHWRYKEGGGQDAAFDQKLNWLRQILEPTQEERETSSLIDRFKSEIFEDRVYALTPAGKVVDLPSGATPLDFAYYVHTDLGHRCRGAKVNGRMVQLTHVLENGEQVEIITAKNPQPSRDWLIPQQGYLASPRARAKVRQWFRRQNQEHLLEQGRALLGKELHRHGVEAPHLNALAKKLGYESPTDLHVALGGGDLDVVQLDAAIQELARPQQQQLPPVTRRRAVPKNKSSVDIDGIGDLLKNFAQCCRPVPPDPISGYITVGRGVSIHRADCKNLLRLRQDNPARVLNVSWRAGEHSTYPVEVVIDAYDRRGLIKDISSLLATEEVNIQTFLSETDSANNTVRIKLTAEVSDLEELSRIVLRIGQLPNIIEVRRTEN
ncbi:MAG: TGS domain-containing protein [Pseudomonadota bacterium]